MDTDEGCLKPPEAENETETALETAQNSYTSGEIRMSNQNLLAEQVTVYIIRTVKILFFLFEKFCTRINLRILLNQLSTTSYFSLKGQLILKCLIGVFTFCQNRNQNNWTSSKVEFVHSLFGRNIGLKK